MSAKCGSCGVDVDEPQPTPECPRCGYDGYSDWDAHRPKPRRARPVYDDSQSFDIRELARDRRTA